jgi:hypothetical protein
MTTQTQTTIENADVSKGETVEVTAMNNKTGEELTIKGEVTSVYGNDKFAVQVEGEVPRGKSYIVNNDTKTVREGNHVEGHEEIEGFRPMFVETEDEESDEDTEEMTDTLTYENTVETGHEKTRETYKKTKTVEYNGEVIEDGDMRTFQTPEHTGTFHVSNSGNVEYEPEDDARDRYEVGTNAEIAN